jgi:hypothetical protein
MALDPFPLDLVAAERGLEALPEFGVLDRLAVGRLPAVLLPAMDPAGDALPQILAVGVDATVTGRFSASSAAIAAINSMRLLVVCASPPESSFSTPLKVRIAPQPPGPGLPEQAPSVRLRPYRRSSLQPVFAGARDARWKTSLAVVLSVGRAA